MSVPSSNFSNPAANGISDAELHQTLHNLPVTILQDMVAQRARLRDEAKQCGIWKSATIWANEHAQLFRILQSHPNYRNV